MKVGIVGSGGREHAICKSIKKSSKIDEIYCFPGNAGTAEIATNIVLNLAQKVENLRLHSIDIMPGDQKNSFKLILVYAQL